MLFLWEVVGGGTSGCETSLATPYLQEKQGIKWVISLVHRLVLVHVGLMSVGSFIRHLIVFCIVDQRPSLIDFLKISIVGPFQPYIGGGPAAGTSARVKKSTLSFRVSVRTLCSVVPSKNLFCVNFTLVFSAKQWIL